MSYSGYGDPRSQPGGGYGGGGGGGGGGGYGAPPGGGYGGGYGAPPGGAPPGYGGGFSAPTQQGPPPGADPQLWTWFTTVDTDRSGAISAPELQRALINGDWTPFELDTVKLLMGIFDTDRTGTIGFHEFTGLWQYIKDWQNVFRHFDRDHSGSIEKEELQRALGQFGYNLSPQMIAEIQKKFVPADARKASQPVAGSGMPMPGGGGGITFDRFVRACVTIKQLTEQYERFSGGNRNSDIRINYEQFMGAVMSLP